MQYTDHYNLNLPEGTDIVNPLIQDNPNYSAIDQAMFSNKQSVIGSATEIVSGTIHTITRSNTDSNYFRFTATGNWTAGDSMSVDGTTVTVYLSDGTTPTTGAYIINTEVLALLSGTRVTLLVSTANLQNSINAVDTKVGDLAYLNTANKSSIVSAINEVSAKTYAANEEIAVANANMTFASQLSVLKLAFDNLSTPAKLHTAIKRGYNIYRLNNTLGIFSMSMVDTNILTESFNMPDNKYLVYTGSITDKSSLTDSIPISLIYV